MYPVIELAKYIVVKCIKDNHPISNLQLQKILFYIQREFLQNMNKVAFPEDIEAWPFGPVVPAVYYYFCGAGAMPITLCNPQKAQVKLSQSDNEVIDSLIESKRELYPWDMVTETHKRGGAWESVYRNGMGKNRIISKEDIKRLG